MTASLTPSSPASSLPDIQSHPDERGVALLGAGISSVAHPLRVADASGNTQQVAAEWTFSVALPPQEKGTHMSRFMMLLSEWDAAETPFTLNISAPLAQMVERLESSQGAMAVTFPYFVDKASPVTALVGAFQVWITLAAFYDANTQTTQAMIQLGMPMATCCPCSKAISEYGAHNQRALCTATLLYPNAEALNQAPSIADLVTRLDECASCPVFPILKRPDEKWVTERQYDNPKFVEDVARDVTLALNEQYGTCGGMVRVEALESIHGHNALATHSWGDVSPLLPLLHVSSVARHR